MHCVGCCVLRGCLVHIALVVLDDTTAVDVTITKSELPLAIPLATFPKTDVNMAIRPSLHPIPAPQPPFKVTSIQLAVIEQLQPVSVISVPSLQLPRCQRAAVQTTQARLVIDAKVMEFR